MTTPCDCGAARKVHLENTGESVECTKCSRVWWHETRQQREYPTIVRTCSECDAEFLNASGLQNPRMCPDCFELWLVSIDDPRPPGLARLIPKMHPEFWWWPHILAVAFVVWLLVRVL